MKIAVFHMNQLGDMMFSLPLLYNLRQAYPQAQIISILKSPALAEFINLTSLIDKVIFRPNGANLIKKIGFINYCRTERFCISIHISQSIDATIFAFFGNIEQRIGFETALLSCMYTKRVKFSNPPSIINNLRLLESLNIDIHKTDYVGLLEVTQDENYIKSNNIDKNDFVVVISPGTSRRRQFKQWIKENYAEIIRYLIDSFNAKCILTGINTEYTLCNQINLLANLKAYNLAGKTSVKQLCILLGRANLFIGVDSGAMHVASALGTPTIALFDSANPNLIGPQGNKKIIIKKDSVKNISVEDVKEAIKKAKFKGYI